MVKTGLKSRDVSRDHFSSGAVSNHPNCSRLVIRIMSASSLLASDVETGKSDPVCFVWCGFSDETPNVAEATTPSTPGNSPGQDYHPQGEERRWLSTSVCMCTTDPVWNEDIVFPIDTSDILSLADMKCFIFVRDEDRDDHGNITYDDLGMVELAISDFIATGRAMQNSIVRSSASYILKKSPGMRRVEGSLTVTLSAILLADDIGDISNQLLATHLLPPQSNSQLRNQGIAQQLQQVMKAKLADGPNAGAGAPPLFSTKLAKPRPRSGGSVRGSADNLSLSLSSSMLSSTASLRPSSAKQRMSSSSSRGHRVQGVASPLRRRAPSSSLILREEEEEEEGEEGEDDRSEPELLVLAADAPAASSSRTARPPPPHVSHPQGHSAADNTARSLGGAPPRKHRYASSTAPLLPGLPQSSREDIDDAEDASYRRQAEAEVDRLQQGQGQGQGQGEGEGEGAGGLLDGLPDAGDESVLPEILQAGLSILRDMELLDAAQEGVVGLAKGVAASLRDRTDSLRHLALASSVGPAQFPGGGGGGGSTAGRQVRGAVQAVRDLAPAWGAASSSSSALRGEAFVRLPALPAALADRPGGQVATSEALLASTPLGASLRENVREAAAEVGAGGAVHVGVHAAHRGQPAPTSSPSPSPSASAASRDGPSDPLDALLGGPEAGDQAEAREGQGERQGQGQGEGEGQGQARHVSTNTSPPASPPPSLSLSLAGEGPGERPGEGPGDTECALRGVQAQRQALQRSVAALAHFTRRGFRAVADKLARLEAALPLEEREPAPPGPGDAAVGGEDVAPASLPAPVPVPVGRARASRLAQAILAAARLQGGQGAGEGAGEGRGQGQGQGALYVVNSAGDVLLVDGDGDGPGTGPGTGAGAGAGTGLRAQGRAPRAVGSAVHALRAARTLRAAVPRRTAPPLAPPSTQTAQTAQAAQAMQAAGLSAQDLHHAARTLYLASRLARRTRSRPEDEDEGEGEDGDDDLLQALDGGDEGPPPVGPEDDGEAGGGPAQRRAAQARRRAARMQYSAPRNPPPASPPRQASRASQSFKAFRRAQRVRTAGEGEAGWDGAARRRRDPAEPYAATFAAPDRPPAVPAVPAVHFVFKDAQGGRATATLDTPAEHTGDSGGPDTAHTHPASTEPQFSFSVPAADQAWAPLSAASTAAARMLGLRSSAEAAAPSSSSSSSARRPVSLGSPVRPSLPGAAAAGGGPLCRDVVEVLERGSVEDIGRWLETHAPQPGCLSASTRNRLYDIVSTLLLQGRHVERALVWVLALVRGPDADAGWREVAGHTRKDLLEALDRLAAEPSKRGLLASLIAAQLRKQQTS